MNGVLRIGTRGSALARAQAGEIVERLRRAHPDLQTELVVIKTHGDEGYRTDLGTDAGGKRAFTKRIEDALLEHQIDVAVHSLKDIPTDPTDGLILAAIPPREDPRDVIVANGPKPLTRLRPGTRVGTSSLRRRAQLLARWPEIEIVELHGNVDTRLRRLETKEVDAVAVAAAGIRRLKLDCPYLEPLDADVVTPAPGQGALAVQTRADDARTNRIVARIEHRETRQAIETERALSAAIGGGCNIPFGALASIADGGIGLKAVVASVDGARVIRASVHGHTGEPEKVVAEATRRLREGGASEILEATA